MRIICITGIDGAGKSTLARNLVAYFNANGVRAKYFYGRTYPVISRLFMWIGRTVILRKHDSWNEYQEYHASKKQKMRNPLLLWGYTLAILFDYFIQIWLKLLPLYFSDQILVLDRYIYDTVISDLTVHLNYSKNQTARSIDRGLSLLPIPILTVLIDLQPEVAFSRKDDVPHIDYLIERREWYLTLLDRPEVVKINGEQSLEFVFREVLVQVESLKISRIVL